MSCLPKQTDVLMVGVGAGVAAERRQQVKAVLKTWDMAWEFVGNYALTFEQAMNVVLGHPNLQIVQISNDQDLSDDKLLEGCRAFAEQLGAHPQKPWITFSDPRIQQKVAYVFEERGLDVKSDRHLAHIIHGRWASQIPGHSER